MKIFKLFINENIKTWKKLSTKILIIAVILSLVGVLGIVKLMQKVTSTTEFINENREDFVKSEVEYLTNELNNEKLDVSTRNELQRQLEMYKMFLEYNVSPYEDSWKRDIIEVIASSKISGFNTDNLIKVLKEDDFIGYIEIQKSLIKEEFDKKEITEQEYKDELNILELKAKYEIGKSEDDELWKINALNQIKILQENVRTGINHQTRKLLKAEEKEDMENQIKIALYRLEHNIPDSQNGSDSNFRMRYEMLAPMFSISVLSIAAIVIAGGTISTEVSSGTIKFWALTPNRRWKIMTAKLLSVLFYIIVITLVVAILSVAISNIFFDEQGEKYLYVKNGEVREIGNTLYTIEYYLAKTIPVIIFALFSVMLSTITRNTAVSVSLSVGLYMGNGIVMQILNMLIQKDWIKFVPFNNLNIVDKIFPNSTNIMNMMSGTNFATSTSLGFSLAVLGVCAILMLITTYDSFNKRDII